MQDREPCPLRLIGDSGSAFAMGFTGGAIWHFFKGYRNTPKDLNVWGYRFQGGLRAAARRCPRVGGGFGIWGLLFSGYDCVLVGIRGKEDMFNPIASGFLVGATLAARGGIKSSLKAGMVGGIFLTLIEGVQVLLSRVDMGGGQRQEQGMHA